MGCFGDGGLFFLPATAAHPRAGRWASSSCPAEVSGMGRLFRGDMKRGLENQPFQLQLIPEQRGWEWYRVPSAPRALGTRWCRDPHEHMPRSVDLLLLQSTEGDSGKVCFALEEPSTCSSSNEVIKPRPFLL